MSAVIDEKMVESVVDGLEGRGYVASEKDIEMIALESVHVSHAGNGVRQTYLRALVASTKAALGMADSRRRRVPTEMSPEEMTRQLEALETTHARFYEVIQKTVEKVPIREDERGRERAAIFNARCTFARTSKSTLRSWISSGNNLAGLVPAKVTKYALAAEVSKSRSPAQARAPSERYLHGVAAKILARVQAAKDQSAKIRLIETVLHDLVTGLSELGVEITDDIEEAMESSKLLQTQTGIVWLGRKQAA
jgi:hypothetical protein